MLVTSYNELYCAAEESIFEEMIRKLTNIRIEEFLSTLKQKTACQKGNASMKEQNLRDSLLTHHTNLHSRIKMK